MSEYQFVGFRAIDGSVSEKNLTYMRRQSTRAEITPWSFENEYDFGDFRGDALEMMRRGYDFHLHYANFGTRLLLIRFPRGLPDAKAAEPYLNEGSLEFLKDKHGPGGSLAIEPFHEPGDLEDLWEVENFIDRLVPLRAELLEGDLRPLYLAHLAIACDIEHDAAATKEPPIPAGLGELTPAQRALAAFYDLSDSLIAAAAQDSPPLAVTAKVDPQNQYAEWLRGQPAATKETWLAQLMAEPQSSVRSELLTEFRKSHSGSRWPTVRRDRTIAELQALAEDLQKQTDQEKAANAARQRAKKLADLVADPARALRKTEELVAQRSTRGYEEIAKLLADLRDALAGSAQSGLAERQAQKLKKENPTLRRLTAELRAKGLIPK